MPSPAQVLPAFILEEIIYYTVGDFNWRNVCSDSEVEENVCFMTPLLGLCSAWREVALDKIYRYAGWCNSDNCECYFSIDRHLHCGPKRLSTALETGNIARVKSVRFFIECSTVLDGSPHELFKVPTFRDQVHSGVRAIDFVFKGDPEAVYDPALFENSDTAQAFCDNINRMFPNTTSRTISGYGIFGKHEFSPFVRTLASGLFANAADITAFNAFSSLPICIPHHILNVRCIFVEFDSAESPAIELIRRNAETLEDLAVTSKTLAVFSKIVIDDDGTPIVYPCVDCLSLSLYDDDDSTVHSRLDSPAGTPFPSLGKLSCSRQYPFGNDILFRGNAHTLEHLEIGMCSKTVQLLKSFEIFSSERFPVLRYANGYTSWDDTDVNSSVAVDFFFQLAANASVLKTHGADVSFSSLGMSIGQFGQHITILKLSNIAFTLHEMLELVKRLPHLKRFGADTVETDELCGTDRSHDYCRGRCRIAWEKERGVRDDDEGSNEGDDGNSEDEEEWDTKEDRDSNADEESNIEDDNGLDDGRSSHYSDDSFDSNLSHYSIDSYDRYHNDGPSSYVNLQEFFFAHLDTIYADMDFVDELYRQYYPLSKSLFLLDADEYTSIPVAGCKIIALLFILCPAIRRAKTDCYGDDWGVDPISKEGYFIERHEVEETEQHASLVSRLQLSSLSIG